MGFHTSLAVVDGCPAISYQQGADNYNLKYARATTSTGASASDWTQIIVESAGNTGFHTSLAVIDGCPAISYRYSSSNTLKFAQATTSTGGSGGDWSEVTTVDSSCVGYTSLAEVDGRPAISYVAGNSLKYAIYF